MLELKLCLNRKRISYLSVSKISQAKKVLVQNYKTSQNPSISSFLIYHTSNLYKPASHCRIKNHINVCYSGKLYPFKFFTQSEKHESRIDLKWLNRIEMPFCPVFLPWKCPLPNAAWAPCPLKSPWNTERRL